MDPVPQLLDETGLTAQTGGVLLSYVDESPFSRERASSCDFLFFGLASEDFVSTPKFSATRYLTVKDRQ